MALLNKMFVSWSLALALSCQLAREPEVIAAIPPPVHCKPPSLRPIAVLLLSFFLPYNLKTSSSDLDTRNPP